MRASWLVVLACDLGLCGGCLRIGGTTTDVSPALVRNPPLIFYPRFVFVANSDSNTISGYRITDNGFLEPFATVPVATGVHPGYLAASPFHKFLYVANLGSHTISGYLIDRNTGQLTECPASPFAVSSDDIRGMVASGTGSLYVATLHNGIWEYAIDERQTGNLTKVFGSGSAAPDQIGGIAMDIFERYLFVAKPSTNSVGLYALDGVTGNPSPIVGSDVPTGSQAPRWFGISPDGTFVYAGNTQSMNLSAFKVDGQNGRLIPVTNSPFAAGISPSTAGTPSAMTTVELSGCCCSGNLFAYVSNINTNDNAIAELGIANDGGLHLDPLFNGLAAMPDPYAVAGATVAGINFVHVVNRSAATVQSWVVDDGCGGVNSRAGDLLSGASRPTGKGPEAIIVTGRFVRGDVRTVPPVNRSPR